MKQFTNPEIRVNRFEVEDVIAASSIDIPIQTDPVDHFD